MARIIPFFAFPEEIRRSVERPNAIKSSNHSIRKIIENRSPFPSEEAPAKLLYRALNYASKKWTTPIKDRLLATNLVAISFGDRLTPELP